MSWRGEVVLGAVLSVVGLFGGLPGIVTVTVVFLGALLWHRSGHYNPNGHIQM